jgi:hypothetical protein
MIIPSTQTEQELNQGQTLTQAALEGIMRLTRLIQKCSITSVLSVIAITGAPKNGCQSSLQTPAFQVCFSSGDSTCTEAVPQASLVPMPPRDPVPQPIPDEPPTIPNPKH